MMSFTPRLPKLNLSLLARVGLFLLVLSLAGGAGWWYRMARSEQTTPIPLPETTAPLRVKTAFASRQPLAIERTLTGTVEAVESVTLTSRVLGQIRQMTVQEGDRVAAGQVIAAIDVSDLRAQRNQAQATVTLAQANAQNAQAQLNQARAQRLEAKAELADAELDRTRMAMLQAEGAIAQVQLDRANTRVAIAQARIEQAQASIHQAEAAIAQAQAQVKQAQAEVSQNVANLDYGTVRAPFAGVVTRKYVAVGAMAGPGQALVTLDSRDRLRFSVEVPESLIAQIQPGQSFSVFLDALNRSLAGRVSQIIPTADPISRNFTVKLDLATDPAAIPGMFGRLKLTERGSSESRDRTVLTLPTSALVRQFGVTGVYIVAAGKAQFHPVAIGTEQGETVAVFSGVEARDRVILSPPPDLTDGTAVASQSYRPTHHSDR